MKPWLDGILCVWNLAVLPYSFSLLGISLGALCRRRPRPPEGEPRSRFLVVIPAHDEEVGIAATVASCRRVDYPEPLFSILVIADNCSDGTASIAARAGARVAERSDALRKSKGYALEYQIGRLIESGEFDALDAIVVVDADTTVDPGLLRRFDEHLRSGRDWIQCYYSVADPERSWRTRLMMYAFSLFNGVMLLGQEAVGSSAALRGNGMCFSTRGLRRRPWASYGLVEDLEFSWMLRLAGERIAFEPSARVYGAMPAGGEAAANQRRRCEFGRREIRRKYVRPLLDSERLGRWEKAVALAEITMPTMGTLVSLSLILMAWDLIAFATAPDGEPIRWLLAGCGSITAAALGLYASSPFLAMGLPWRYAWSLGLAPVYLGWKLLVNLGGRPRSWVRTAREARVDPAR